MSTPLGSIALWAGATKVATLTQARLGELSITTDLMMFRAPFGTRWHRAGGRALPALQEVSGIVAPGSIAGLQAALPNITRLGIGAWRMPVRGAAGPISLVPALQGHRLTAHFVIDPKSPWEADP